MLEVSWLAGGAQRPPPEDWALLHSLTLLQEAAPLVLQEQAGRLQTERRPRDRERDRERRPRDSGGCTVSQGLSSELAQPVLGSMLLAKPTLEAS